MVRPATMAFDTQEVIKADTLFSRLDAELELESTISILGSLTKLVAVETLHEIGYKLAERHQPHELDYYARFGINREMVVPNDKQHTIGTEKSGKGQGKKSKYYCFKCQKSISQKAALFCFDDKARFGGRAYCFSCQKQFKRP
jgi:predicted SprT family Zn-dependent metalloprotease